MSIIEKNLVFVGAGDFSRELLDWIMDCKKYSSHNFVFLDDDAKTDIEGYRIASKIDEYVPKSDDVFICAIADPRVKKEKVSILKSKGAKFICLIHPTVIIGKDCTVGEGSIICPYTVVTKNVKIGEFVTINVNNTIGHDAKIESFCTISPNCGITGHVHIKQGVFMGTNSGIIPGKTIGEFATIGAGSVTYRKVKPYKTVVGVPAQPIN